MPAAPPQAASFAGVQPQLAKLGDKVFLTYGQDNVISVRSSIDGGQSFGPAVTIKVPGRVSLGMHRGPRIAATPVAVMVALVAGAKGGGTDGDLHLYRSRDGGATFDPPVVINDVPGSAREGLHGFAANALGFAALAWLDLRGNGTQIYSAVSRTDGLQWSGDQLVYASPSGSACECCHPSVAAGTGGDGRWHAVMFRNNLNGNRDMYVTRSQRDGYGAPEKAGTGSWKLDACPMDGGGIVIYGTNTLSVWRRGDDVYQAISGRPEQMLGPGRDPAIDQFERHYDVVWSSPAGIVLTRDGGPKSIVGDGRFPAVVSLAHRTVVAWETSGTVKVVSVAR